jgi:hypothetical protein
MVPFGNIRDVQDFLCKYCENRPVSVILHGQRTTFYKSPAGHWGSVFAHNWRSELTLAAGS